MRDETKAGCGITGGIIALVVVAVLISGGVWLAGVLLSGPAGRGEQIKHNNSEVNRTFQQQHFEDLYADIKTYDGQLTVQARSLKSYQESIAGKPDDALGTHSQEEARLRAVVDGIRNQCIATQQQYNADARKVLAQDWRAADLPQQIGSSDPATDCREDNSQ